MNQLGTVYEDLACRYLEEKGYRILERNYSCRQGEIDIIAMDNNMVVFVEVKFRKDASYGQPYAYVSPSKIRKICHTASYYMFRHQMNEYTPCRFDVISILGEEIKHLENAFEYIP